MSDKMTQEEAIEQANEFLEPNRNISWDKKEDIGTVIILLLKDKEAIKTLLSTAKKYGEVVGKLREEIENTVLKSYKAGLERALALLTEED